MGQVPLEGIFGGLRDGYRAEVRRFFGQLMEEAGIGQGAGATRKVPHLGWVIRRVNEAVPAWVEDMGGRLERDLMRASEQVLADMLRHSPPRAGEEGPGELATRFSAESRPGPPRFVLEPLRLPPSSAVREALRRGSGTAALLWAASFLVLPEAERNAGYVLSTLVGLSAGLHRFQRALGQEADQSRRLIGEHLERLSSQVASAVEEYVVAWVRALSDFARRELGR